MDAQDEDLRSYIGRLIAEGFRTDEQIIGSSLDYAEDESDGGDFDEDDCRRRIEAITAELAAAHRTAERSWEWPTDCDLLDRAFAELESRGIVARQNFACCQPCGHAEIGDEIEAAKVEREVRGYTFYHQQDTESVCEGGALYLAYGAVEEGREALANVVKTIVDVISLGGLQPVWDGDFGKRIQVVDLDWKRRRP